MQKKPENLRNGFKNPERIKAIHKLPCVRCLAKSREQKTPTIAHHKIGMGIGKKASDNLTMALCVDCHTGENGIHTLGDKWDVLTQDDYIMLTELLMYGKKGSGGGLSNN